jgi:hypothetical protein
MDNKLLECPHQYKVFGLDKKEHANIFLICVLVNYINELQLVDVIL